MPPSATMPEPPEVLLCGHHLRAGERRLVELKAAIYDLHGRFVEHHGTAAA